MKREEEEEDGYLKHYQHAHQTTTVLARQIDANNHDYECGVFVLYVQKEVAIPP